MNKTAFLISIFLAATSVGPTANIAQAQMAGDGDTMSGLDNRVGQLEYKLKQLRRDFDTGGGSLRTSPSGTGFSSEGAQLPESFAARVEVRMGELEEELTRLTGQLEELGFSTSSLTTRLDKLVEDIDFRLTALERSRTKSPFGSPAATGSGALAPGATAPQSGQPFTAGTEPPPPSDTGQPPMSGTGLPQSLGTVSPTDLEGGPADGPAPGAAAPEEPVIRQAALPMPSEVAAERPLPPGTPKEQYDFAYKLVRQGDYAQAETAFREFGQLHPNNPLAGNARYWLGETYYVRQDYVQAADVFIGVVTGHPKSPKRPHSMLKLGMSLLAMGQKSEGCATLSELLDSYTEGADATRMRAVAEREQAGCS